VIGEAVAAALGRPLSAARRVAGGDINAAWCVELEGGTRVFVKTRVGARPGEYATEAAGLRWLGSVVDGLPVAEVLAVRDVDPAADAGAGVDADGDTREDGAGADGDTREDGADPAFLALAWLDHGRLDGRGEEQLGRGLAHLHAAGASAFGAAPPGAPFRGLRLGEVELTAATGADWPAFYGEHRLAPLARAAEDRGALPPGGRDAIEAVIARLDQLAGPPEPPARLHGDLWSGNVLADVRGRPWLIDPAAHGGHREVDLAMLALFGAPSPRMLAAYAEVRPPAAGHADRVPLWQLFPLLVHAVLFGGRYGGAAVAAARCVAP